MTFLKIKQSENRGKGEEWYQRSQGQELKHHLKQNATVLVTPYGKK